MSLPNIPDINAANNLDRDRSINLLLASVASEELSLAHMIDAEAEKIQYILGTLVCPNNIEEPPTLNDLSKMDQSVDRSLRNIIKKGMLLQFKLDNIIELIVDSSKPAVPSASSAATVCDQTTDIAPIDDSITPPATDDETKPVSD